MPGKAGKSRGRFYRILIRRADDRFDAWLAKERMMAVSLEDKLARLPAERRAKVDERAAELIAEELTLRDLRRALDRTQVHLARELGVKQETVSRLESAATCSCRRCAVTSKRWAESWSSWRSSRTARPYG